MEQRGGIPYHYDFIYVLEMTDSSCILKGEQGPQWLSIEQVEKGDVSERPFPNTLRLAREIMEKLNEVCWA